MFAQIEVEMVVVMAVSLWTKYGGKSATGLPVHLLQE